MTRLPENYKFQESTWWNYFKITEEPQEFRILTSPIVGYEYFAVDGDTARPVRQKTPFESIPEDSRDGNAPKEFRAFVVWNHNLTKLQIMEITQQSIKKEILKYVKDSENWWDPKKYDLRIVKSGKGKETRYSVTALPKSKFESDELYNAALQDATKINLPALYDGDDPFKPF